MNLDPSDMNAPLSHYCAPPFTETKKLQQERKKERERAKERERKEGKKNAVRSLKGDWKKQRM